MHKNPKDIPIKKNAPVKKLRGTTTDDIHHLAFDNSVQANLVSRVRSGKILIANRAACRLLGYSKKELLDQNSSAIVDMHEVSFKKMLKIRKAKGHSTAWITMIKKDGTRIPCEITSAIFKDSDGYENGIVTITNISKRILKQKNIDALKEKIVADNIALAKSKQKTIDARNAKTVADNIALAILKQKNIDTRYAKKVAADIVLAISRQIEIDAIKEKTVTDNIALAISRQKNIDANNAKKVADDIVLAISRQIGIDAHNAKVVADNIAIAILKQKYIDTKKDKIVADNILLAQKKSAGEKLHYEIVIRKKLHKEFKENFKLTFNASSDVLYDSNLLTNEVIINDAYEKDFGYKIVKHMTPAVDWVSHIHADDKDAVYKHYTTMLASEETEWECKYRFLKADDSVANVVSRALVLRDDYGKAYRMIGYMKDLSKQKVLEEKLELEIKLKEKQIEEAAKDAKETERSDIGKELHDNINQLLGASKMYLEMAKHGGDRSDLFLSRSSEYTLIAIEEIRKLTRGLSSDIIKNMGLSEAINHMTHDTMEANAIKISYAESHFKENSVNDKFKLTLFRIVQEQLNNILKHARATEVIIRLTQNKKSIVLSLSDNGIGFDTGKKQKGIGLANIKSRAASYKGTADFVSQIGHGCVLTVNFPLSTTALLQAG